MAQHSYFTELAEGVTWSPGGGDLNSAEVIRGLVCGRSDEVIVQTVVAELQQLHQQTMLTLIIQVQVLTRRLHTHTRLGPKNDWKCQYVTIISDTQAAAAAAATTIATATTTKHTPVWGDCRTGWICRRGTSLWTTTQSSCVWSVGGWCLPVHTNTDLTHTHPKHHFQKHIQHHFKWEERRGNKSRSFPPTSDTPLTSDTP